MFFKFNLCLLDITQRVYTRLSILERLGTDWILSKIYYIPNSI